MTAFEHFDSTGLLFVPMRFVDGGFRVVDPSWLNTSQAQRFSEANSEDVLLDFIKRGFHVWMQAQKSPAQTKLVGPSEVSIRIA